MIRALDLLEGARTIHVVGQLRSEPMAIFLRYILTMLGRDVRLLDANGGLATQMARVLHPEDVVFAVSFRFHAKEVNTAMHHYAHVTTCVGGGQGPGVPTLPRRP